MVTVTEQKGQGFKYAVTMVTINQFMLLNGYNFSKLKGGLKARGFNISCYGYDNTSYYGYYPC